ncbi:MAG: VWA domain-containing protein [Cyanobacteria bacterium P01_A01_bin.68]
MSTKSTKSNATISKRPGGRLSTRPLHFIWLCDCSGSMSVEGKIQSLNHAIREAIPHMQNAANDNPYAEILVRAIAFSDGAKWHIPHPTPVEHLRWSDLCAEGITDMGQALSMVSEQLKLERMSDRALPPILVLISDGQPTDNFVGGLEMLMHQPWGKKAVKIAIAIGRDANCEILQRFIGNPEFKPLQANNPEALIRQIKWVSTVAVKSVSSPISIPRSNFTQGNVSILQPEVNHLDTNIDVW